MNVHQFLLARIAEDEAAVTDLTRRLAPEGHELLEQFGDFGEDERWMIEIPAGRLSAECETKRRIVELHHEDQPGWCNVCDVPADRKARRYPCTTVRLLALPYAEHPDYREEWRP